MNSTINYKTINRMDAEQYAYYLAYGEDMDIVNVHAATHICYDEPNHTKFQCGGSQFT